MPVFDGFYREVEKTYPAAPEKLKFNETLKRVLNRFVGDLITNTQARIDEAGIRTLEDVRDYPQRLAAFSPEVEADRKQSKEFSTRISTSAPALEPEKDAAERVVSELFAFWMANPTSLPPNYQEQVHTRAPAARNL